jgi:hypothetical protein
LNCERLAKGANTPEGAQVFRNLAKQSMKLAADLEWAKDLVVPHFEKGAPMTN